MGDGLEELVRMDLLQGEWWNTFLSRLFFFAKLDGYEQRRSMAQESPYDLRS